MPTHVAHPKCPDCGRALYKAMEQGAKVKTSDLYQYCRNDACALWGYREEPATEGAAPEPETEATDAATPEPAPAPPSPVASSGAPKRRLRSRPADEQPEPPPAVEPDVAEAPTINKAIDGIDGEDAVIDGYREKIKWILKHVSGGHSAAAIGLALAILNQELGHHNAANTIIDELGLQAYGLEKTGVEDEAAAEAEPSTDEAES